MLIVITLPCAHLFFLYLCFKIWRLKHSNREVSFNWKNIHSHECIQCIQTTVFSSILYIVSKIYHLIYSNYTDLSDLFSWVKCQYQPDLDLVFNNTSTNCLHSCRPTVASSYSQKAINCLFSSFKTFGDIIWVTSVDFAQSPR